MIRTSSTKRKGVLTNAVVALTVKSTSDVHDVSIVGAPAATAGVYVPVLLYDEDEQEDDAGEAEAKPQDAGYCPARRCAMVTKLAKDHVRSYADVGIPVVRLNCSEIEPLDGRYFCNG
jgi:hypothetical protein